MAVTVVCRVVVDRIPTCAQTSPVPASTIRARAAKSLRLCILNTSLSVMALLWAPAPDRGIGGKAHGGTYFLLITAAGGRTGNLDGRRVRCGSDFPGHRNPGRDLRS